MLKIFRQTSLDIDIPQMTIAKVEIKKLTNRAGVKSNGQITHYAPIKDVLTGKKAVSEADQKDMPSLEFGKDGFVKPESVQQVKADVKEQVRQKKVAMPSIDMTAPMSFDDMKNIFKRMDSGDITVKELRQQWNRFIGNQDVVKADLNQKTQKELLNLSWSLGIGGARKSDRKPELLEMVLNRLKRQFAPVSTSQGLYESIESVTSRTLETLTDDFIQERAAKIKEAKERTVSTPTPQPKPTSASVPVPTPQPEPSKSKLSYGTTKHTKTGEDLHTVSMADRVSKDEFAELKAKAKEHGGYYSTYTKSFIFKSEDDAKKFASSEPSSTADVPTAKTPPSTDKIRSLAEKTIADAEAALSKERLTNTHKRARQAADAEVEARKRKQLGQTMLNVADAISSGESQYLDGLKSRSDFEALEQQLKRGQYNREKAEDLKYDPNRTVSEKDLNYVRYPSSYVKPQLLLDAIKAGKNVAGFQRLSEFFLKLSKKRTNLAETQVYLDKEDATKLKQYVQGLVDKKLMAKVHAGWLLGTLKPVEALQRMGITNEDQLRAAAREYFGLRAQSDTPDPIKTLERKLIGKKFAGYFPTPQKLSAKIAETADIKPGMKVLEPSAGKGNLADAVLPFVGGKKDSITTIEPVGDLREILQAKGYKVTDDSDFLQHKGKYDRIVMNPPFENLQDADHVRHAYDLLEKGGKLVAITSPSPFFNQNKKAKEFRDWFESVGGIVEDLPEGSFKTSDNPTGVSTRMVTITK